VPLTVKELRPLRGSCAAPSASLTASLWHGIGRWIGRQESLPQSDAAQPFRVRWDGRHRSERLYLLCTFGGPGHPRYFENQRSADVQLSGEFGGSRQLAETQPALPGLQADSSAAFALTCHFLAISGSGRGSFRFSARTSGRARTPCRGTAVSPGTQGANRQPSQ